ncbi:hypothetical protein Tco_0805383 [Tanacetum coccineum]
MTHIPLRPDLGVLQSSQENTSSSFQSKLQISPPSSNEPISPQLLNPLLDNISDVPSRPSNPQPLQIHPSLDITLSLSPITPLDHIHDTPSPPSPPQPQPPIMGHPLYYNYHDYHGSTCIIEVDMTNIDSISKLPYPTNVKVIRSFLGHAGFYRRFIQDFSKIARLMTQLLVKEFDIEIRDKKGVQNLTAYHLSRLENPDLRKLTKAEIQDLFPEEQLMLIYGTKEEPWTDFKTPLGTTPFRLVYRKACHLPMELEHKDYWALKSYKIDLTKVGANRFLLINELDELRIDAYDSSIMYKERTKRWHDK